MRLILTALLTMTAGLQSVHAATQQQCEALEKPVAAKFEAVSNISEGKPTPKNCALTAELIKIYANYKAQADRMNCPAAYVDGKKMGGALERNVMLTELQKSYNELCR